MVQEKKIVVEDKTAYFTKITVESREKVKMWLAKQEGKTRREKSFFGTVKKAVESIDYDYWIATVEPSVSNGKIYYRIGEKVATGFSFKNWKKMAQKYWPERGSRIATKYELFIWYALRIYEGLWTVDYVVNNSSSKGNYWDSPNSSRIIEEAGARICGGYKDGQGNTYKIVTSESEVALVGGFWGDDGNNCPVADVLPNFYPHRIRAFCSAVLVFAA